MAWYFALPPPPCVTPLSLVFKSTYSVKRMLADSVGMQDETRSAKPVPRSNELLKKRMSVGRRICLRRLVNAMLMAEVLRATNLELARDCSQCSWDCPVGYKSEIHNVSSFAYHSCNTSRFFTSFILKPYNHPVKIRRSFVTALPPFAPFLFQWLKVLLRMNSFQWLGVLLRRNISASVTKEPWRFYPWQLRNAPV